MNEIYRKQATRLDELEAENRKLAMELKETEGRFRNTEEELEELREANSEIAELKTRAERSDVKSDEIDKLVVATY